MGILGSILILGFDSNLNPTLFVSRNTILGPNLSDNPGEIGFNPICAEP